MRLRRIALIGSLLAFGLTLSACESMDPTDWFTTKKPLPGDRKEIFPGGVPGVPQGVPSDLVEGYKPPPDQPPPRPPAAPGGGGETKSQAKAETRAEDRCRSSGSQACARGARADIRGPG